MPRTERKAAPGWSLQRLASLSMNLTDPILRHARIQPHVAALVDGERTITYSALADIVLRTVGYLAALGVKKGDYVGLCLKDDSQHVVALLAIARLGATAVQIDSRSRPAERGRIANAFALRLALVTPASGTGINCPKVVIGAAWHSATAAADRIGPAIDDWHAPIAVLASSGTSGLPKFTVATHLQYYFHIASYLEVIPPTRHRFLSILPLYFSAGRVSCLAHLLRGDTVILHPALSSGPEIVEVVSRHKITIAFLVPSMVRQLLALADGHRPLLPDIDLLISAGAPLFAEEKGAVVQKVTHRFCELYGAAAIGPMTALRAEEIRERPTSVGRPFSLIDIEVVDDSDQPLGPGTVGQLRCGGPGLTFPAKTSRGAGAADFRDGWHYPGELASIDELGYVFLQGRASEVIFQGGAKIFPSEVEAVLQAHECVAEAAVVGRKLANNEQEVVAYVVAKRPVTSGELIAHCRTRLTAFKVPREIKVVADLPRNTSGKVLKRALTS
jgi:acyl-coenzyme A synthetase/AMP-(fatty) acid ligase